FLYRLTRSWTRITGRVYERAARRDFRLAVQALEGTLLSKGSPDLEVARALHGRLRHRRAQQPLLPAAREEDVREVAPLRSRRFPLRGEAQPLHHAHQTPEYRARQRRALVWNARRARAEGGRRARAATSAHQVRRGARRAVLQNGRAAAAEARDRATRRVLVQRRRARLSPAPEH